MSKSLNKVMLIGRLGRDPEVKYTADGTAYAKFSLATSDSYKAKDGSDVEKTEWHYITAWRRLAEVCGQYLKKGSKIYLEGSIRSYVDPKDETKKYTGIDMSEMIMLDNKKPSGESEQAKSSQPEENKEDLPF